MFNRMGYKFEKIWQPIDKFIYYFPEFAHLQNLDLLSKSLEYIQSLKNGFPELKIEDHKEGYFVSFNGIKMYVESIEEFFILKEVFVEKDYHFKTKENVVLIDIGTNIGTASLFFSKQKNIQKIYAFEPVQDTFDQAKLNFEINQQVSKVFDFSNIGLGSSDREETFLFDKKVKGNTGVRGTLSSSYKNNTTSEERKVVIKNASAVFQNILSENDGSKIAVKMDCEGAEYEIFENLANSNLLTKIDIFLIEWHDKGAEVIEDRLIENGFSIFSRNLTSNAGMIYAIKN